jgi:predicted N-formylglutamate amidohydrolase
VCVRLLQAEQASRILPDHHVDLGLAKAGFCEHRQSRLKRLVLR